MGKLSLADLKAQLRLLEAARQRLTFQYPDAGLGLVVGFGLSLWRQLKQDVPSGFHDLDPISVKANPSEKLSMPATGGDLVVHVHASRADLCFLLLQTFLTGITDQVQVLDERVCFRYLDQRDLTGFLLGLDNPLTLPARTAAAVIGSEQPKFAGGSFVFNQRFVHDLAGWQKLKVDAQEHVIGRTKLEGIELPEGLQRTNSHSARLHGIPAIVRHSLPYGLGSGEQGVMCHAYSKDLNVFDLLLARQYGISDGVSDRLLQHSRPVSGGYFFAPAQEMLAGVSRG
jgi:putative iron-dependent peroxidase